MGVSPPSGAIVLGGIDYYLMTPPSFDQLYMTPRGIVDRGAGGQFVSKPDMVREILLQNDRVWIVSTSRIMMRDTKKSPVRGELFSFIESVSTVKFEFFGGKVFLWERDHGDFAYVPDRGGAIDAF